MTKNPGIVTIKELFNGFGISSYGFFNTAVFISLKKTI